ncbi:MAG: hypothetical protein WCB27_16865 [Thermoguttaceae bacterium]
MNANGNSDEFTLANPPPPHKPWSGEPAEQRRQTVLLSGIDCQSGQMDLFQTDGEAAKHAPTG